ncbi:MAG: hypothetical protein K9L68_11520 [Spirochaetales bacterium]|nr:hypothetical protein [Spirochaetales bacterium]MCF7939217.1 hypothetical protein [Spirochaetales bacterium]
MAGKKKKTARTIGIIISIVFFPLFCWPGIMMFDKTEPLFLGLPPLFIGTYLSVVLTVIILTILVNSGVES